jgi:electron transport complex protein RnfD
MSKLITVAPSPHIHSGQKVSKLMYGVVFAMLPALAVSIYFFGMGAIYVTLLSVVSCLLFEFLIQKYIMKTPPTISDGSAMVTGILLAFNLPSSLPPHIIIIGALVSIGIGKLSFWWPGK